MIHHSSTSIFLTSSLSSLFSLHSFCGQLCCPKIFDTAVILHSSTAPLILPLFFSPSSLFPFLRSALSPKNLRYRRDTSQQHRILPSSLFTCFALRFVTQKSSILPWYFTTVPHFLFFHSSLLSSLSCGQICYPKIFDTAVILHSSTAPLLYFLLFSLFSLHLFCRQLCYPKIFNTAVIHHGSTAFLLFPLSCSQICRPKIFGTAVIFHSSTAPLLYFLLFSLFPFPLLLLVRPTAVCKYPVSRHADEGACISGGGIPNKANSVSAHRSRCCSGCCYSNTAGNGNAGQFP